MVLSLSTYQPGMAPGLIVNHTSQAIKMNQKGNKTPKGIVSRMVICSESSNDHFSFLHFIRLSPDHLVTGRERLVLLGRVSGPSSSELALGKS